MTNQALSPAQIKAARALLAWSQQDLARAANVGASTVADFERGYRTPVVNNAEAMRSALETAGISFLPGGAVVGSVPTARRSDRPGGIPIRWVDATDLSQWAERRVAQGSMPEFLSRLIRAATGSAARIEFPCDEGVQFAGWDGICDIETGTENVPVGCSGWEIGTQRTKITEKADSDYKKRSTDPLGVDMSATTFVSSRPAGGARNANGPRRRKPRRNGATCGPTMPTIWCIGSSFTRLSGIGLRLPWTKGLSERSSSKRHGKNGRSRQSYRSVQT